jgi:hypothetical protein
MADHLRKYESLWASMAETSSPFYAWARSSFTLTPQRMRMIVEAFSETLELGLMHDGQIVVRQQFEIKFPLW